MIAQVVGVLMTVFVVVSLRSGVPQGVVLRSFGVLVYTVPFSAVLAFLPFLFMHYQGEWKAIIKERTMDTFNNRSRLCLQLYFRLL